MNGNVKNINKPRNANMDILRIVSMLLIVFLHSIDHSGVLEAAIPGTAMYYYVYFGYYLAQICVNCFVLLSGYFMIESSFRPSKLVNLWLEVVFYSVVIRVIFILTGQQSFSVTSLISCFVPVITGRYWFITIYFGLYLISPFLNVAIKAMSKKQFTALNVVLFLIMSCWSSIHPSMAGMNSGGGWGLAWFVVLYCFAAWMRLYYNKNNKLFGKSLLFFAIPVAVTVMLFCANYLNIGIIQTTIHNWYRYDSALATVMSLVLMAVFINADVKNAVVSKIITKIAPLTLGVYLIHAHADVSPWSWAVLNLPQYMSGWFFPVAQILAVLGIFIVCIAIDAIRNQLFKLIKLTRLFNWIDSKSKELMELK